MKAQAAVDKIEKEQYQESSGSFKTY